MTFFGIEIKHPSPGELALAALFIALVAVIGGLLNIQGIVAAQTIWPTVAPVATGTLLSAFGVSLASHGWRAAVVMVAVGSIIYLLVV